jgi:hypothetical protein
MILNNKISLLHLFIINQQFNFFTMAVKPEIIKARLKVLFPKANLSTKRLDALAAKLAPMPVDDADDAAVDLILNQANDFNSFEDIAREDDRVRTLEAKANPNPNPTPAIPPATENPTPATPPADMPEWAKGLLESNKALLEKVTTLETGKITETKKQTAQSVFETSEVLKSLKPEIKANWLNRIDVNSETPIEDQIKSLETEFTDIRQAVAENTRYSGPVPVNTSGNNAPSEKDIESIVDNLL